MTKKTKRDNSFIQRLQSLDHDKQKKGVPDPLAEMSEDLTTTDPGAVTTIFVLRKDT